MKPMLFNTDMVRAILAGKKTVTRRVIKPQPEMDLAYIMAGSRHGKWSYSPYVRPTYDEHKDSPKYWTPPCNTDDILYVRETWRVLEASSPPRRCVIEYKAGGTQAFDDVIALPTADGKWRPSIHMPERAARIFLRVKGVRVERLQDITEEGKLAEGAPRGYGQYNFYELWDRTIKPADLADYGWDANPWVWVIEFERCASPWAEKEAAK